MPSFVDQRRRCGRLTPSQIQLTGETFPYNGKELESGLPCPFVQIACVSKGPRAPVQLARRPLIEQVGFETPGDAFGGRMQHVSVSVHHIINPKGMIVLLP